MGYRPTGIVWLYMLHISAIPWHPGYLISRELQPRLQIDYIDLVHPLHAIYEQTLLIRKVLSSSDPHPDNYSVSDIPSGRIY